MRVPCPAPWPGLHLSQELITINHDIQSRTNIFQDISCMSRSAPLRASVSLVLLSPFDLLGLLGLCRPLSLPMCEKMQLCEEVSNRRMCNLRSNELASVPSSDVSMMFKSFKSNFSNFETSFWACPTTQHVKAFHSPSGPVHSPRDCFHWAHLNGLNGLNALTEGLRQGPDGPDRPGPAWRRRHT